MNSSFEKRYPSKLLLFGEYTVLLGSQGLAIPFSTFGGSWRQEKDNTDERLVALAKYLQNLEGSLSAVGDSFYQDVKNGLRFQSDIPTGYGLGSSGALCAAIYDKYAIQKQSSLEPIKKELAQIESFFHGQSSGLDPLISYLNQSIKISSTHSLELLSSISLKEKNFFLINTQQARQTAPLVELFFDKIKKTPFLEKIHSQFIPLVNRAVSDFLKEDYALLWDCFSQISYFQYQYFKDFIPIDFHKLWQAGLEKENYKLKLCGAGGGGFLLGMGDMDALSQSFDLIPI